MAMLPPSCPSLIPPACQICRKQDELVFCRNCEVVPYCGWVHHREDQLNHLEACGDIGALMVNVKMEEQKLRRMSPTPFETQVGRFCFDTETRPYLMMKSALANLLIGKLGQVGGQQTAVETARTYCYELLPLDLVDCYALRHMAPALDIRLGGDQAAYDLIQWYGTAWADLAHRWKPAERPFLDVENANMLESTEGWWTKLAVPDMGLSIPLALIKLRLLFDFQAMQAAKRHLAGILPPELIDNIVYHHVISSSTRAMVMRQVEMLHWSLADRAPIMQTPKAQIVQLYKDIHSQNRFFWPLMLDAPDLSISPPYRPGPISPTDEALSMAFCNYASWAETPRAMETVQALASVS